VLLWRITDQAESTISVALAGRKFEDLQDTPGPLTRFLPIQSALSWDLPLQQVAKHVSESLRDAHKWQEFFDPAKSFPSAFEYVVAPDPIIVGKTQFTFVKHYSCMDRFKIKLSCTKSANDLVIAFDYDAAFYRAEDIEQLSEEFRALIDSVFQNPRALAG